MEVPPPLFGCVIRVSRGQLGFTCNWRHSEEFPFLGVKLRIVTNLAGVRVCPSFNLAVVCTRICDAVWHITVKYTDSHYDYEGNNRQVGNCLPVCCCYICWVGLLYNRVTTHQHNPFFPTQPSLHLQNMQMMQGLQVGIFLRKCRRIIRIMIILLE